MDICILKVLVGNPLPKFILVGNLTNLKEQPVEEREGGDNHEFNNHKHNIYTFLSDNGNLSGNSVPNKQFFI